MKKSILLSIATLATLYSSTSAQTYSPMHSTKLVIKNGAYKLTIMPPTLGGDFTLTLPDNGGSPNQVLQTDGSGALSWVAASSTSWALVGNMSPSSNIFGTLGATDVDMQAGGTTQMTLRNTGGINIPTSLASGVGVIYQNDNLFIHSFGTDNFFAGNGAGNLTLTGSNNVGVGANTLNVNTTGSYNTAIGYGAGSANTTGTNNTFVGYNATASVDNLTNATALGNGALVNANDKMQLGNSSVTRVSTYGNLSVRNLDYVWPSAFAAGVLTSDGSGNLSWAAAGGLSGGTTNVIAKWTSATAIGNSTITDNGTTVGIGSNVSIDLGSGNLNITGEYQRGGSRILDNPGTNNLRVGSFAGHNNSGVSNTYVGSFAGAGVSSGSDNVYVGFNTGVQTAPASSSNNVMIGSNIGTFSSGSDNNTFIGYGAAVLHTSGDGNTFLGTNAGSTSTTESDNTLLGGASDMVASITRATAVGQRAYVSVSDALVLGAINGVNGSTNDALVGIGTSSPTQKLEVKSGNLLLSNAGTPGQLQLQGTSSGISTFASGTQGATTINYTLPIAQPMASQVLTATAVSGSGPYNVTLGWTMGGITYLKTANESVNSSGTGTTFQDDDHLLGIPVNNGEIWAFDGFLLYSSPSNTPDLKAQFVASQNVTISSYWTWGGIAFVTNTGESSVSVGTTSTTVLPNYNATPAIGSIHVKGTIVNISGSDATFKLQWAQNSTSASDATLLAGSYLTFSRVK